MALIAMRSGMVVSCNAYFAQLGAYRVGPEALLETAKLLGVSVATPTNVKTLRKLPFHKLPMGKARWWLAHFRWRG